LVAYVVPQRHDGALVNQLRPFLQEKIPEYMVPAAFVLMDKFPLTPSGKIDRRSALFEGPVVRAAAAIHVAPRGEMERAIAGVWREALQVEKIGIHDNFFDLGGHSLLMVQVQNKLGHRLGKEVSIVDLFRYPTINTLAHYLSQEEEDGQQLHQAQARAEKQKEAFSRRRNVAKRRLQ
ncbi:MAG: phosphopantetheine-binding protein, partial [Candidatus Sulfotelmatobacter sp.]